MAVVGWSISMQVVPRSWSVTEALALGCLEKGFQVLLIEIYYLEINLLVELLSILSQSLVSSLKVTPSLPAPNLCLGWDGSWHFSASDSVVAPYFFQIQCQKGLNWIAPPSLPAPHLTASWISSDAILVSDSSQAALTLFLSHLSASVVFRFLFPLCRIYLPHTAAGLAPTDSASLDRAELDHHLQMLKTANDGFEC